MGWYQRREHGDSELNAQTTMKFALVVCFAALVACEPEAKPEAEADPWLAYGYGYPYAYGGYRAYGYGYPYAHHGLYYGKRSVFCSFLKELDGTIIFLRIENHS